MQTQTKTQKKVLNKKSKLAPKPVKATISLGKRIVRKGQEIPLEDLFETLSSKTKNNLETLSDKFGIEWKPTAFIKTVSKKVKSAPVNSFIVEGETKKGKSVFFDRYQLSLFVDGRRESAAKVLGMTKREFSKI